ncbi:MAG: hypothetical protein OXS30_03875 [Chloroflexota bacterium]|nr:hypothetical protein [Chloroflexota bacterium]
MPILERIITRIWGAIRDHTPFGDKIVRAAPFALVFVATHLGHVAAREYHEGHAVHEALIAVPIVLGVAAVLYFLYWLGPKEPEPLVEPEPEAGPSQLDRIESLLRELVDRNRSA